MDDTGLVKAPQRRGHNSISIVHRDSGSVWGYSVPNVFVKTQIGYFCHPIWRGCLATPTFRREYRALGICRSFGVNAPEPLSYSEENGVAELIVAEVPEALPLDEALRAPGANRRQIVENVASAIGALHRHHWTHGALGNDHILVQVTSSRVHLIDLEKARRNRLLVGKDLDRFWRRTGCLEPSERALFQDVYSRQVSRTAASAT